MCDLIKFTRKTRVKSHVQWNPWGWHYIPGRHIRTTDSRIFLSTVRMQIAPSPNIRTKPLWQLNYLINYLEFVFNFIPWRYLARPIDPSNIFPSRNYFRSLILEWVLGVAFQGLCVYVWMCQCVCAYYSLWLNHCWLFNGLWVSV